MPEKIIFDCDNTMGVDGCDVDDGLALLYLSGKETVEIWGITTTYGNSDLETVHANTATMLKEMGRTDIPLLKGCPHKDTLQSEAAEFLVETINRHPGDISILGTGSLTNLYGAYLMDQSIFHKVKRMVLMGGITQPLVINGKVLNEMNFSCDPAATQCVLQNGENVAVITGNNCLAAYFGHREFCQRLLNHNGPAAQYINRKCRHWFNHMMAAFHLDGFYNWDVVAAAYLVNSGLFRNHYRRILPDHIGLERGLLCLNAQEKNSLLINFPDIGDLNDFKEDVYQAWFTAFLRTG
ncbi:nucleoside hydrolase [Candidatus Formimonas warabiya]|uniref:Nucleoside hydrolase n=1 Tax=Formimonas warabiya TaxID=1761012 RepID=A0A3G1KMF9_FORW1|nr:nucleoside hydrolase [Candidatus Formimonas warabiya]ATW23642.1 nucleoside hydrolase [Candidatus Formimonas warabiya]